MIKFNLPEKLNGEQLVNELKSAGVNVIGIPFIDGQGDFYLNVSDKDKTKTEAIVKNHVGVDSEITLDQKLSSVGLSLEELKAALV
jgi:hypothetical protein